MSVLAEVSSDLAAGLIGLVGAFVGGGIAGLVSFKVAREAREAAERAWMRDSRRVIYDRFLDGAQTLFSACEHHHSRKPPSGSVDESVRKAHTDFFQAYATVQTVAHAQVIEAVRRHAYRLWEFEEEVLRRRPVLNPDNADAVARSVRDARHSTIDAMRCDLGAEGSAKPPARFNPFALTVDAEQARRLGADEIGESGARDDYVEALRDAYDTELRAAGQDGDSVRPGWEGSRNAEVAAGAGTRPAGSRVTSAYADRREFTARLLSLLNIGGTRRR